MSMNRDGWHFLNESCTLRYDDGRKVTEGSMLSVDNPARVNICDYGMHASPDILSVLRYAPGCNLSRVTVYGVRDTDDNKFVGVSRYCHRIVNVREQLVAFARWCADRTQQHKQIAAAAAADAAAYAAYAADAAAAAADAAAYAADAADAAADAAAYAAAYAAYAADAAYADAAAAAYAADAARAEERKLQAAWLDEHIAPLFDR